LIYGEGTGAFSNMFPLFVGLEGPAPARVIGVISGMTATGGVGELSLCMGVRVAIRG